MATRLRSKSFQHSLFFSVGIVFLLFVFCFMVYQYRREKEYKIDVIHSRLQMYNYEMAQTLGSRLLDDASFRRYVGQAHIHGLRVTVIDTLGRVLLDSRERDVRLMGNHRQRREVSAALHGGNGFDIKRLSQSTHDTYFYSATRIDSIAPYGSVVIRTAVPYSAELTRSLAVDYTYILPIIAIALLLGIVLYRSTSRISRHIGILKEFARKAEEGKEIDHEIEQRLPDDELGDISHNIITLYWKLRHSEEEKTLIKRQLTQNAAHELKTPAASIHGYLESIIDHPEMPEEKRRQFLERCYAQSERMNRLLLDMSALTKLDELGECLPQRGKGDTRQYVDIAAVVKSVLADTALQLGERGITADVQLPEHPVVAGDSSLIYGIFRNIIDNSIAYAQGATHISVTGRYIAPHSSNGKDICRGCYAFSVSDNGCGIEPQHLERIFERFYRVDKGRSRKLGGTGLGLAIVKNSVIAHGGTVHAELTPGGGLTISFTIEE